MRHLMFRRRHGRAAAPAVAGKVRLVVLMGDSNSQGRGAMTRGAGDGDLAGCWQYANWSGHAAYRTFIADFTPPHFPDGYLPTNDRIGPGEMLIRTLKARYPADDIVLLPCGVGGTSVATAGETWDPDNPAGGGAGGDTNAPTQYNDAISAITALMPAATAQWPGREIVTEMVCWVGGMNDYAGAVAGLPFFTAIRNIITTFRSDLPAWAGARWVISGLPYDGAVAAGGVPLERALARAPGELANTYYAPTIDDVPDDGDVTHASADTNRYMGALLANIDLDTTAPIWSGPTTFYVTAGRKMEVPLPSTATVVGTQSGGTLTLDGNFEIANLFSSNRVLRWVGDGTKSAGTYNTSLTLIGGNRRTTVVNITVNVQAAGTISPVTAFTASQKGGVYDLSDLDNLRQNIDGTGAVATAGDPVGWVRDLSPNADHWIAAANNTTRPTYQVDADGKAYLQFDGSDDVLFGQLKYDAAANAEFAAGMGIYAAAQSATKTIMAHNSTSSVTPFVVPFQCSGTTTSLVSAVRNGGGGGTSGATLTAMLDSTKRVITSRYRLGTGTIRMRDEAARGAGADATGYSAATNTGATIATCTRSGLGANCGASPANFYSGRVYSHYVISTDLTDMQIGNFADWVNARTRTSALP